MDPYPERLSFIIRSELGTGRWSLLSPMEINSGMCGVFARHIVKLTVPVGLLCCEMHTEYFMTKGLFDTELLAKFWPKVVVPEAYQNGVLYVAHYWIAANGRHYDAEAPEGVDNFFDLPIFQRGVAISTPGLSRKLGDTFNGLDLKPLLSTGGNCG